MKIQLMGNTPGKRRKEWAGRKNWARFQVFGMIANLHWFHYHMGVPKSQLFAIEAQLRHLLNTCNEIYEEEKKKL